MTRLSSSPSSHSSPCPYPSLPRHAARVLWFAIVTSTSNPSPLRLHDSGNGALGLTVPSNFPARRNAEPVRAEAVSSLSFGQGALHEPELRCPVQVDVGGAMPAGRGGGGKVGGLGSSGAVHGAGPGGEEAGVAAAAGGAGREVREAEGVARRAQAQHRLRRGPMPQHRRGRGEPNFHIDVQHSDSVHSRLWCGFGTSVVGFWFHFVLMN